MRAKKTKKKQGRADEHVLAETLRKVLRERFHVTAGERIGLGISGGADSVALLRLFVELREKLGVVPCVTHFNHQLRGKASEADEKFVAKLAAQYGLEFFVAHENVGAKAKRERANMEDVGRRARYAYFERLVQEGRVARVGVAHTADDQAETVLAHILRGTGLAGLAGIHPTSGCVFRPLLGIRRAELRVYLRSKKQAWREDASNRDVTRTRARIRWQLLRLLEKKFNASAVEHFCQLAELAREDNAYLEHECELRVGTLAKESGKGIAIPIRALNAGQKENDAFETDLPPGGEIVAGGSVAQALPGQARVPVPQGLQAALAKRMVRRLVQRVKPRSGELGAQHVEAVLHLAQHGHSGKVVQLPGGVEVRRERDTLVFRPAASGKPETSSSYFSVEVKLPSLGEPMRIDALSCILAVRVIDWPSEGRETSESGAVLDRDRLQQPVFLRHWQPGDAMRPVGHEKRHTLARLLNEQGLTRWEKESWPVLTSAGKVAWALGLPAAAEFAVHEGSRKGVVIAEES